MNEVMPSSQQSDPISSQRALYIPGDRNETVKSITTLVIIVLKDFLLTLPQSGDLDLIQVCIAPAGGYFVLFDSGGWAHNSHFDSWVWMLQRWIWKPFFGSPKRKKTQQLDVFFFF